MPLLIEHFKQQRVSAAGGGGATKPNYMEWSKRRIYINCHFLEFDLTDLFWRKESETLIFMVSVLSLVWREIY